MSREMPATLQTILQRYPYLRSLLRGYRWQLFLLSGILFLQIGVTLLAPLPIKKLLNEVILESGATTLALPLFPSLSVTKLEATLLFASIGLALYGLLVFLDWFELRTSSAIHLSLNERIRRDLLQRIFSRQQSFLDSKKKVDMVGRITGDVENLETLIETGFPSFVRDIPIAILLIAVMFSINLQLSLIFLLALPLFFYLGHLYSKRLRDSAKRLRRKIVSLEEEGFEAFSSMAIVKSLNGEQRLLEKLLTRVKEIQTEAESQRDANAGLKTATGAMQVFVQAGIIFVGSLYVIRGLLGIGDLFQMLVYLNVLGKHVNSFTKFLSKFPKCQASLERLESLRAELSQSEEISGSLPLRRNQVSQESAALTFQDVSFSYGEGKEIFQNYSFTFPNHKLVAIVGQSGAGKTTFSRLLNRLATPEKGSVLVAGIDNREYQLTGLRQFVRILSQETFLISGSVRENLSLATKREPSAPAIRQALLDANALDFVLRLPQGLDTRIGEGGLQLSGGQAKRIHLARAFLDLDSEIILFDEPTSGLDPLSAQVLMESIKDLSATRKLVFWITHRMEEIPLADHVLFFVPGKNPLFSTHEFLYANHALYRSLMEQPESSKDPVQPEARPLQELEH